MAVDKSRLPKNFCQIGEREDRVKIYLEDYVHVYLQRCRQGEEPIHTGVLLGIHEKREGIPCLFICGAVSSNLVRLEEGRLIFPQDAWDDIRKQIREYFPDMGICGWFVHEKYGMSVDRLSLKRNYEKIFAQGDKVLLFSEEDREDFYILKDNQVTKMLGYYIYYEKNDPMQVYMVSRGVAKGVDDNQRPDAAVAFRKKLEEKREGIQGKKEMTGKRAASGETEFAWKKAVSEEKGFFGAKGVSGETELAGERRKNPEKSQTKKEERWKHPDEKKSQQERRGGWLSSASTAAAVLVLAWILGAGSGIWQQNWAKKSESPVMSGEAAEVWNGSEGISGEAAEVWNGSEGISGEAAEVWNGSEGISGEAAEVWNGSEGISGEAAEAWNGSEGISGEAAEAWNGSEGISGDAAEVRNGEDRADSTVLQDSGESGETGEVSESQNVSDEDAEAGYSVHYVRDGETLASICLQYYGTMDMVDMVCEWNHISDPNYIIEGQAIRLPILSGETSENT